MSRLFEALQKNANALPEGFAADLIGKTENHDVSAASESESLRAVAEIISNTAAPASPVPHSPAPANSAPAALVPLYAIASLQMKSSTPVLPFDGKHWHANEQYRVIRTKILQHPKAPKVIVISSAGSGDGKTITSVNVAGALALKADAEVVLVDGDFRRSKVHELLGIPASPGLSDVLSGDATLQDAIKRIEEYPHLHILPAGVGDANPAELLDSPAWRAACMSLRSRFRFVIIDSPPIATVTDYDLLQAQADGVIVVVRPDHTKRSSALKALKAVPPEKMVGVVLNCVERWLISEPYAYQYYGYS